MDKKLKIRTLLVGVGFTLLFSILVGRLYWVQIVEASALVEKAESLWSRNDVLPASNGTIYDRNGKILAQDGSAYTIAVQPRIINERHQQYEVVEALAPILGMEDANGRNKLMGLVTKQRENGDFLAQVEIRNEGWKIDADTAELIREVIDEHELKGIILIEEQKRYYPAQGLAAHVLGYRTKEGAAVYGLETYYDDLLKGEPGFIKYEKDGYSFALPDARVTYQPAEDGLSLRLTIDENIQLYIDQALQEAYEQYSPKSITAIAVDPNTLEVLGLSNYPNYNPNLYWNFNDYSVFSNHAISSVYEPGSTFKFVTLAAAVNEGLFNPDDTFMSGSIAVPGGVHRDHNRNGWGEITYLEGLKRSSNVAFVKMGYEQLGAEKLKDYIAAFGFGQKTGIDLLGETDGLINFRNNIPTEVATATFGQGRVMVTPLQQITALAAIANGGKLMKPYIVKDIIDTETDEVVQTFEPTVVEQVVSEDTARQVSEYLELVVSDQAIGTGRHAYSDDYRIAGKSGTAQKVIGSGYSSDKWVVSFIGFAPVENPRIALLLMMDEPDLGGDYQLGGVSIQPIFRDIMVKSLRYIGVAATPPPQAAEPSSAIPLVGPLVTISSAEAEVPEVIGYTPLGAENELKKNGFDVKIIGHGTAVIEQLPAPLSPLAQGQKVWLLTDDASHASVPDMTGMSLRDVFEVCGLLNMSCQYTGEGYVLEQEVSMDAAGKRSLNLVLQPLSLF